MTSDIPEGGDLAGEYGVLVHSIQRGKRNQIRISLNEFKGREYIDLRLFFLNNTDEEEYRPTRKGVTLPTEDYGELLKGVIELGTTLGLLDPDLVSDISVRPSESDPDPA